MVTFLYAIKYDPFGLVYQARALCMSAEALASCGQKQAQSKYGHMHHGAGGSPGAGNRRAGAQTWRPHGGEGRHSAEEEEQQGKSAVCYAALCCAVCIHAMLPSLVAVAASALKPRWLWTTKNELRRDCMDGLAKFWTTEQTQNVHQQEISGSGNIDPTVIG